MRCLGIDVGSSSIKGAVLDVARGAVGPPLREPFPSPLVNLPPGRFEIDAAAVVTAVRRLLADLLEQAPDAAALFFAGQMGGVLLLDERGRPLSNYLSWRDQRTLAPHPGGAINYLAAIRQRWRGDELAQIGSELMAGSAASLLFWLAEHGQLPAAATPVSIAGFVAADLCGAPPAMHATEALGLLHLASGRWHEPALAALGLDRLRWPRLVDLAPVGTFAADGRAIPCYVPLGDQQCALFGAQLARDELSINVSTGSQVSRRTAELELGPYQSRCYFGGDYLNTITHLPAGRSLNVLVDLLTELARAEGVELHGAWDYIAAAAESADGGGLACDLAFFAGPLGERGRIEGITTENLSVGNLFRAAFAAMADNYAACAERLWPARSWRQLVLTGGLAQSIPALGAAIRGRLASPAREIPPGEDTLTGLLHLACQVVH